MSVSETTHLLQRAIESECLFNGAWIPASGLRSLLSSRPPANP